MNDIAPIYIDATMLYRWRHLAPVGIVRLERMLTSHLRFRSRLGPTEYVIWEHGYRYATPEEAALLDDLLGDAEPVEPVEPDDEGADGDEHGHGDHDVVGLAPTAAMEPPSPSASRRAMVAARRTGLKAIARVPDHLRPFAEQAAWSMATLGVESARYARRARERRKLESPATTAAAHIVHQVDFRLGGDLVALGLGWEYIDHEAMYRLAHEHGIRIHMPAFDLIPVTMPQMNVGQSHLVHRYYAEMAHYADTVTSISYATEAALHDFYVAEDLPLPRLATNQLPGFVPERRAERGPAKRRHRFEGKPFALTVSTIEVRKNHLLLAKIWTELVREGIEVPRLVVVGRVGWDVNELMQWAFHAPELNDRFTLVSDVEDDELVELYAEAEFTLFPSRIEGWGLPITEALTYGKVCVHSTDPAQCEASQGLMPAFHPDDFVSWKAEITRLVTEPTYRAGLEQAIAERYVPRTTEQYCLDYEQILAERRSTRT